MSDMADARQCFSSKPIRTDGRKVFERPELGRSKPFAKDWQIILLLIGFSKLACIPPSFYLVTTNIDPMAVVCDLE